MAKYGRVAEQNNLTFILPVFSHISTEFKFMFMASSFRLFLLPKQRYNYNYN